MITYGNNKFYFSADYVHSNYILEKFSANELANIDFFKHTHHGYDSGCINTKLLTLMRPKVAFVPDGYLNMSQAIKNVYSSIGTKVYRTNSDGNLLLTSDGTKLTGVITKVDPAQFRR